MDQTPKSKRTSLSLGRRLQKHNSESPKNLLVKVAAACAQQNAAMHTPRAHSKTKAATDACTPPQQRYDSDESAGDGSPRIFDVCYSPITLFSQTFNNAEVEWHWNHEHAHVQANKLSKQQVAQTLDSCNSKLNKNEKTKQSRQARMYVRQTQLQQNEKTRIAQSLQHRCDELQEQLKCKVTQQQQQQQLQPQLTTAQQQHQSLSPTVPTSCSTPLSKKYEDFNDFLNDSESDNLLLAATQQVEQKICFDLTQVAVGSQNISISSNNNTTPTSSKQKRDSFYMKFLEEDFPEEWLSTLDDVLQAAPQSKKPRNSLQRFNSMPSENHKSGNNFRKPVGTTTTTNTNTTNTTNTTTTTTSTTTTSTAIKNSNVSKALAFKRHASAAAISTSNSNLHQRRQPLSRK